MAHKHFLMGDQSGAGDMGHTFQYASLFVKAEENAWQPSFYVGDDDAYSAAVGRYVPSAVPASRKTLGSRTAVAKTSHYIELKGCAGKGITVEIAADNPVRMQFRGLGLEFTQGGDETRDQAAG